MAYLDFPAETEILERLPWETILTHCVIDQTAEELEESGELRLLEVYRDSAIQAALDYQNTGFSLDSKTTVQAILLLIADMWRSREDSQDDRIRNPRKRASFRLLDFRREGIL